MNRVTFGGFRHLAVLWVAGSIGLAVVTWVCFRLGLSDTTAALLYLIVIVLLSLLDSFISSAFFSVVAVGLLDFFFFQPIFTLEISDPRDVIALVAFLLASLVVTALVRRLRWLGEIRSEQRRLLESKEELQATLDSIPTLAWRTRTDGFTEYLNKGWLDYTGFALEKALGWEWITAVHPDDLPGLQAIWQEMLAAGKPGEAEARLRRFDGVYRWFLFRTQPVRDASGAVVAWYGTNTDIEDRKRAEHALQRNEAYSVEAQRLSSMGIFATDVVSDDHFWSDETYKILGIERDVKPSLDLINQRVHPDDRAHFQREIDRARRGAPSYDYEQRLLMPDGQVKHLHVLAHRVKYETGKEEIVGALMDITARKKDEEAQKELRAALNSAPVAVWSSSPAGLSDFANQSWLEYLNLSAQEIQGFGWAAALHPDDAPGHLAAWQNCAANGVPFQHETRFRRFDGEYRWFLIQAVPHRDADGNIVKWHGTCIDIEDRKQSERALQDSEQRYRHLFHHIPIALVRLSARELTELFINLRAEGVTDLSAYLDQHPEFLRRAMDALVIEEVNEQAIKTLGAQNREQLLGPGTHFWQSRPETFRRSIESRFNGSPMFEEETKLFTLDGREIDVLFTAARLGSMGERMSIVGIVDITERVRAQDMLQQVQAEFARAARISVLGELAASIAHEVNQPLAAIRTNSETGLRWLDRAEPNVAKARELVQRNVDDARRAADIIARIRTMAAGRRPQQMELSLHEVIQESIAFLRNELQSKGVSISLDLAPALPQVTGDRIQLQQVIVNLAINAVQAMAHSSTTRRTLLIRTQLSDAGVSCTVEDSGPGIGQPHLAHLFDSFFTTKDAGMGMGLPVSRSIIEAHGGQIRADNDSTLGGARFSFALPVNEAAAG